MIERFKIKRCIEMAKNCRINSATFAVMLIGGVGVVSFFVIPDLNSWLMLAIFLVSIGVLCCFCGTKKPGFGPYSTSTLLIIMAVTIVSLLFVGGKIGSPAIENMLFAVFGFAGGLFTRKDDN